MNRTQQNTLAFLSDNLSLCVNRIEDIMVWGDSHDAADELTEVSYHILELLVELVAFTSALEVRQ